MPVVVAFESNMAYVPDAETQRPPREDPEKRNVRLVEVEVSLSVLEEIALNAPL